MQTPVRTLGATGILHFPVKGEIVAPAVATAIPIRHSQAVVRLARSPLRGSPPALLSVFLHRAF
jgi:hypothetical protein